MLRRRHGPVGLEQGQFGFIDSAGARNDGTRRLVCELTLRAGRVAWDLNGRAGRQLEIVRLRPEVTHRGDTKSLEVGQVVFHEIEESTQFLAWRSSLPFPSKSTV